ncbi:MAG: ankyrin repeat domain-containing protein [Dongiaceae bacterium]
MFALVNKIAGTTLGVRRALKKLAPDDKNGVAKVLKSIDPSNFFIIPANDDHYSIAPESLYTFAAEINHTAAAEHMLDSMPRWQFVRLLSIAAKEKDPSEPAHRKIRSFLEANYGEIELEKIIDQLLYEGKKDEIKTLGHFVERRWSNSYLWDIWKEKIKRADFLRHDQNAEMLIKAMPESLFYALEICQKPFAICNVVKATEKEADLYVVDNQGNTPLHLAAAMLYFGPVAKALIEKTPNAHYLYKRNNRGETPLMLARDPEVRLELLEKARSEKDIYLTDNQGLTAIHLAAMAKDKIAIDQFRESVESKKRVQFICQMVEEAGQEERPFNPSHDAPTSLRHAILVGDVVKAKELLSAPDAKNLLNAKDAGLNTLFHYAIAGGNDQLIEFMLHLPGMEAVLYQKNKDGDTPLALAIQQNDAAVVGKILRATRQVKYLHEANSQGKNIFHVAREVGDKQIVRMLAEHVKDSASSKKIDEVLLPTIITPLSTSNLADESPLVVAAANGDLGELRRLLQENPGAINQVKYGNIWSLLKVAAYVGHAPCVRALIEAGADINITSLDGWTSLMCAAGNGHLECVKELIRAGADLEIANKHGNNALIQAVIHNRPECMKELIKAGANINAKSSRGSTALIVAVENRQLDDVRWLLKNGADIEIKNDKEQTALMIAIRKRDQSCIDLLIEYGALAQISDYKEETPLSLARRAGLTKLAIRLTKEGRVKSKELAAIFKLVLDKKGDKFLPLHPIWHPLGGETESTYQARLNNILLAAIQQKDLRSVFIALNSGASPEAVCFARTVSPLALAMHLEDKEALELMLAHLAKTHPSGKIEEFKKKAEAQIKIYYAVLAKTVANSCSSDKKYKAELAKSVAERFEKGRFIEVEIRKSLHTQSKDRRFMTEQDVFDFQLKLDANLVRHIKKNGIRASFPSINKNLVSDQECAQILQELIIMIMLQQRMRLSLPSDPINGTGVNVELTESLHDTLVGSVATETDRIMKEYASNSIYLPPEIRRQFDWKKILRVDKDDNPQLDRDPNRNILLVEEIYLKQGGIDLSKLKGAEPLTYLALQEEVYQNEKIEYSLNGACFLDNVGASLSYEGSNICVRDKLKIVAWGAVKYKDGRVEKYRRDDWAHEKYMAEILPKTPVFEKQFALLSAIYSIMPIAQIMVMTNNIPDFSKLPGMNPYVTEKTQPPVIVRIPSFSKNKPRSAAELRDLLTQASETGDYKDIHLAIYGGCTYSNGFTAEEKTRAEMAKIEAEEAKKVADDQKARGYVEDTSWKDREKGNKGLIVFGRSGMVWDKDKNKAVPDPDPNYKDGSPYFTDDATVFESHGIAKNLYELLQMKKDKTFGYREGIDMYVLIEDVPIKEGVCENNIKLGAGGGKQYYIADHQKVLRPCPHRIDLYRDPPEQER